MKKWNWHKPKRLPLQAVMQKYGFKAISESLYKPLNHLLFSSLDYFVIGSIRITRFGSRKPISRLELNLHGGSGTLTCITIKGEFRVSFTLPPNYYSQGSHEGDNCGFGCDFASDRENDKCSNQ